MRKTIKELLVFGSLSMVGFVILLLRMKITQELYFIFLIWNMFLATVPLLISQLMPFIKNKTLQVVMLGSWVIFFPNAPYIITDLLHLKFSNPYHFQLDLILISYCAFYGLVVGYYALQKINLFLESFWNWTSIAITKFNIALFFLSGFGIYIGRFLRWNSWDILQAPRSLFFEMYELVASPIVHKNVWFFTVLSGLVMWIGYAIFRKLINLNTPKLINRYNEIG